MSAHDRTEAAACSEANASRRVGRLAPEQLHRKRAIDRDNQRHHRARTQNRVRLLEAENSELRTRLELLRSHRPPSAPAIWHVLPRSSPPIGKLDHLILYLTDTGKRDSTFGDILAEITQTTYPSVASLLNPLATSSPGSADLAKLVGKHGLWMDITSSASRTAMMYNICLYVRWLLSPTEANYMAMPSYLRPIPLQLLTPHPRCFDIMPWPRGRAQLINELDLREFEKYRVILNNTISVNWPFPLADILACDAEGNVVLNPLFVDHIGREENWTVGAELAAAVPATSSFPRHPTANEVSSMPDHPR